MSSITVTIDLTGGDFRAVISVAFCLTLQTVCILLGYLFFRHNANQNLLSG